MTRWIAWTWIVGSFLSSPWLMGSARADVLPTRVEARLWVGYDSNLLDASDLERTSFETGDPATFFAVDRMSDQFVEGEVRAEWDAPRSVSGRPSLRIGWERRQYIHTAIRSMDELTAGLRVRPSNRTRLELEVGHRPQVYNRHRWNADAQPGEPQFRPDVYRRWGVALGVRQVLDRATWVDALLEATTRRYREPFGERDREGVEGGVGLLRELGGGVAVRGGAGHRVTWTRNDPWDPDDRSYRSWIATTGVALGRVPGLTSASLDLELEWRRFTSRNPDDEDHYDRLDRGGEAELEIVRSLSSSFTWVGRASWRWSKSNFPSFVEDEDGPFEETVIRTGIIWGWKKP